MILTVLFASVLFFAGLSMKMSARWSRIAIFALGVVVFLVAAISLLAQPVEFSESLLSDASPPATAIAASERPAEGVGPSGALRTPLAAGHAEVGPVPA